MVSNSMFSNSTEGGMFTAAWCAHCAFAWEGDGLCDEAAPILWGDDPPAFLVEVDMSPENPVGVVCQRFEATA